MSRSPDSSDTAAADTAPTADPAVSNGATDIPDSYEKARDELAMVVNALEEGGLTLDESLRLWERGQALATACETFLAGARQRVETVLAEAERSDDGRSNDENSPAQTGIDSS